MSSDPKKPHPAHAPPVPHEDRHFMDSTPARPIRILAEYLHPLVELKKQGIADTIVMFGSARIESREVAQVRLKRLQKVKVSRLPVAERPRHRAALHEAKSGLEM